MPRCTFPENLENRLKLTGQVIRQKSSIRTLARDQKCLDVCRRDGYSQYAFVEAFINEKELAWITAHVHITSSLVMSRQSLSRIMPLRRRTGNRATSTSRYWSSPVRSLHGITTQPSFPHGFVPQRISPMPKAMSGMCLRGLRRLYAMSGFSLCRN